MKSDVDRAVPLVRLQAELGTSERTPSSKKSAINWRSVAVGYAELTPLG